MNLLEKEWATYLSFSSDDSPHPELAFFAGAQTVYQAIQEGKVAEVKQALEAHWKKLAQDYGLPQVSIVDKRN